MNNKYNNCNYNIIRSNGTELIQSDKLPQDEVFHGFSTRNGGVSREPYASLNLGLSRDEPKENILRNFRILCDAFGLDFEKLVIVNHEHGSNVIRVDSSHCGRGLYREPLPFCDGLITDDPNVVLVTAHADCGAVFLYDKKRPCRLERHAEAGRNGVGSFNADGVRDESGRFDCGNGSVYLFRLL